MAPAPVWIKTMSSGFNVYAIFPSAAFMSSTLMPGPVFQVTEVEDDAVAEAVVERDAFGSRRILPEVPQGIDVRADVIPGHDHVAGGQRGHAVLGCPDVLGELLPGLVHRHGRPDDPRKRHHVVVHAHAQIDEPSGHE